MEVVASRGRHFPFVPSFAGISARSFPFTFTWSGAQWMWVVIPRENKISAFLWAFRMYSCPGRGHLLVIWRTADWLSQKIQVLVFFFFYLIHTSCKPKAYGIDRKIHAHQRKHNPFPPARTRDILLAHLNISVRHV